MTILARLLFFVAVSIAPAHRKEWLEAMAAEFTQVPRAERFRFAAGAIAFSMAAFMEETMTNKVRAGSFVIMTGSAFLAFVGISNAFRNLSQDPAVTTAFGSIGVLWLAVFVAAMLRRWDLLLRLAAGGLAASIALGVAWSISVPALAQNSPLFGALTLEALVLFTALLGSGMLVRKLGGPDHA